MDDLVKKVYQRAELWAKWTDDIHEWIITNEESWMEQQDDMLRVIKEALQEAKDIGRLEAVSDFIDIWKQVNGV